MKKSVKISCSSLLCSALFVSLSAFASESAQRDLSEIEEEFSSEDSGYHSWSGEEEPLIDTESQIRKVRSLPVLTSQQNSQDQTKNQTEGTEQSTLTDQEVLTRLLSEIEQGKVDPTGDNQEELPGIVPVTNDEVGSLDDQTQPELSQARQSVEEVESHEGPRVDQYEDLEQQPVAVTEQQHSQHLGSSKDSRSSESSSSSSDEKALNKYAMTKVEYKIKKHKLMPLVDSEFWQANPGKLPYSKCMITSINGGWEQSLDDAFIVGFSAKKMRGQDVFCYSKKHHTAFMIPVQILKDKSVGASITVSETRQFRATVKKLKGKKLNKLFGKYSGFQGGLGLFVGASGAVLGNHGVALYINTSGADLFDISLAYRKLNLEPRKLYSSEVFSAGFASKVNAVHRMISLIQNNFSSQNSCYDELMAQQFQKLEYLKAMPDGVKYHKMNRYWIHWLQRDADFSILSEDFQSDSLAGLEFVKA